MYSISIIEYMQYTDIETVHKRRCEIQMDEKYNGMLCIKKNIKINTSINEKSDYIDIDTTKEIENIVVHKNININTEYHITPEEIIKKNIDNMFIRIKKRKK